MQFELSRSAIHRGCVTNPCFLPLMCLLEIGNLCMAGTEAPEMRVWHDSCVSDHFHTVMQAASTFF